MKSQLDNFLNKFLTAEQLTALNEEIASGLKFINGILDSNEKTKARKLFFIDVARKIDELIEHSEKSPILLKAFYDIAKRNLKGIIGPALEMMAEEEELSNLDDIPDVPRKNTEQRKIHDRHDHSQISDQPKLEQAPQEAKPVSGHEEEPEKKSDENRSDNQNHQGEGGNRRRRHRNRNRNRNRQGEQNGQNVQNAQNSQNQHFGNQQRPLQSEPKAAQPEHKPEPAPAPIEPKPAPVEPKPVPAETKQKPAEPKPAPVEPKDDKTEAKKPAKPRGRRPKAEVSEKKVEEKPAPAEKKTAQEKAEPAQAEPEKTTKPRGRRPKAAAAKEAPAQVEEKPKTPRKRAVSKKTAAKTENSEK